MSSPQSLLLEAPSPCAACLLGLRALDAEGLPGGSARTSALSPDASSANSDRPAGTARAAGAAATECDENCPIGLLLALRRITRRCAEARAATAAAAQAAHERIRAARARNEEIHHVHSRS